MIDRMGDQEEEPLPQTTMDGCDSDEWSDWTNTEQQDCMCVWIDR